MKNELTTKDISKIIDELEKVKKIDFILQNKSLQANFDNVLERLKTNTFKLAVVGEFSSGKSTFLNALIGKDILKHGAQETTATITEIQNLSKEEMQETFDVYYINNQVEKDIPIDKLIEYTSTVSKIHNVAQEIKKVVIKTKMFDQNADICLVDTPGLNGIADNHREQTIELIENSHACIYLMQVRGLGASDVEFIKYISKYQHNIIFVQNFIDELRELEGETVEQKLKEQKKILKEVFLKNKCDVNYSLVGMSARKALIARDKTIREYEDLSLDDAARETLLNESGYHDVIEKISKLILENEKGMIQKLDTIKVAIMLLKQLSLILDDKKVLDEKEWEESIEGRKQKNYQKLKENLEKDKDKNWKNIDNYIEAETAKLQKSIRKDLKRRFESIIQEAQTNLSEVGKNNLEFLDAYMQVAPYQIYEGIKASEKDVNNFMNNYFAGILSDITLRIQKYTGMNVKSQKVDQLELNVNKKFDYLDIGSEEEKSIKREQQQINIEKDKLLKDQVEMEKAKSDLKRLASEVEKEYTKTEKAKYDKELMLEKLGEKPEAEWKTMQKTVYEDRGGLGILDTILGPKEVQKTVEYKDFTKQNEWKEQKQKIDDEYARQENKYKKIKRTYENKQQECEEEIKSLEKVETVRKKEIEQRKRKIELIEEELKNKREKAKVEYIRNVKQMIKINITNYLNEEAYYNLCVEFEEMIKKNKIEVKKLAKNLFEVAFTNRVQEYEKMISGNTNRFNMEQESDTIRKSIRSLERYV